MATQILTTATTNTTTSSSSSQHTQQRLLAPKLNAAQGAPPERIRTYKDFLTPALHRRFTTAASVLLFFCWTDAWLFSSTKHIFWSWFPLGPSGLRALMIFISCLAVFVVRISGLHIGERTTTSSAEAVVAQFARPKNTSNTLFAVGGYILSACWFGEVFIWSRGETAHLGMLQPTQTYERPQLNENPIFLRCLYPTIALIQAALHFRRDYDRAHITAADGDDVAQRNQLARLLGQDPSVFARLPRPFRVLTERCGTLIRRTLELTFAGIWVGFIVYFLFLRKYVWSWTYSFARTVVRDLPPSAAPSGLHGWSFAYQTSLSVALLVGLWEVSNTVFDAIVAQKPLRKGQPFTSEIKDVRGIILHKSKDPNGSLITGLESKKQVNKSFAFWELYLICTHFEQRRKTIYHEVERNGGSTWSKVCTSTLKQIEDIKSRIKAANEPVQNQQKQADLNQQKKQQQLLMGQKEEETLGLKKIADQGVKSGGDVFAKQKPDFANYIGNIAKSIGQSPGAEDPVSPRARKAFQWGTDHLLSQDEQQRLSREHMHQQASSYLTQLLRTPVGIPFRQKFARQVKAVVFGVPYSNRANIVHAIKSLVTLAVCSLQEDEYGQVQKDIARIVLTLTETIVAIEKFVKALEPSWTDVTFRDQDRKVEEIQELVDLLKDGLEEIMLKFGEYTGALGLSKKEVREAKEAAAKAQTPPQQRLPPSASQPEMRKVEGGSRQRRVYN